MQLTENETRFLKNYFKDYARNTGEDIIGVLMKMGAFRELPDTELVEFAHKLEYEN